MAVCFWYLLKSALSSLRVYSSVQWTSHFLQGTRKTRACLSGQVVFTITEWCSQIGVLFSLMSFFYKINVFLELTTHVLSIPIGKRYISGKCQFMQEEIISFSPLFQAFRGVKEIIEAYISFTKAPSQFWRFNCSKSWSCVFAKEA